MGDHRANIKIEIEFHGIKEKCDMWINYLPGEFEGVDDRIVKFFRDVYERGMDEYNKIIREYWEEQHRNELEKREKDELERLKIKYG